MNIVEFRKLIGIIDTHSVSYMENKECVSFSYDVVLTENIIQKTKEFFKFDNYCILDNSIYKIPNSEKISKIESFFTDCKISFIHKTITGWSNVDLNEMLKAKEILECQNLEIRIKHDEDDYSSLEIKWS